MRNFIIIVAVAFMAGGCLKSKVLFDYSGVQPVIINPQSNWPQRDPYGGPATDSASGVTTLHLYARMSYQVSMDKDVKVKFVKDDAVAAGYNSQWGTSYEMLPDSCFVWSGPDLTIPADSMQAGITITLLPGKMIPAQNYILGFTIVDGGGYTVGSNYKSMVFTLQGQ